MKNDSKQSSKSKNQDSISRTQTKNKFKKKPKFLIDALLAIVRI